MQHDQVAERGCHPRRVVDLAGESKVLPHEQHRLGVIAGLPVRDGEVVQGPRLELAVSEPTGHLQRPLEGGEAVVDLVLLEH
jgi:hypothetical protein